MHGEVSSVFGEVAVKQFSLSAFNGEDFFGCRRIHHLEKVALNKLLPRLAPEIVRISSQIRAVRRASIPVVIRGSPDTVSTLPVTR